MPEQFQCRFCPESYKEVLEFLDHFETHVTHDHPEAKQKEHNPSNSNGKETRGNKSYTCKKEFKSEESSFKPKRNSKKGKENSEQSTKCETLEFLLFR